MAGQNTPDAWDDSDSLIISKRKLTVGIAIAAVVLLSAGIFVYSYFSADDQVAETIPISVAPPAEKEAVQNVQTEGPSVQLELVGLPEGAKIYYKDAPVELNPFKVDRSETIAPLKVEVSGYEPFATTVVPVKDLQIVVRMVPLNRADEPKRRPPRTGRQKEASTKEPASEDDEFKSGNRGTKYSDEFE